MEKFYEGGGILYLSADREPNPLPIAGYVSREFGKNLTRIVVEFKA
ncbi:hypothetical protein JW962_00285 [Candidatus Dojkabacteria bacterium]|nr:hypothetical protein [Candidatus Dojkabacteria bacterium]